MFSLISRQQIKIYQTLILEDYRGKVLVINAFPSVDTGVCAVQTTRFNQEIKNYDNAVVITVSKDFTFCSWTFLCR